MSVSPRAPPMTFSTVIAYSLYTFTAHDTKAMMATIPFVVYGVFRYLLLLHRHDLGEEPEDILLDGRPADPHARRLGGDLRRDPRAELAPSRRGVRRRARGAWPRATCQTVASGDGRRREANKHTTDAPSSRETGRTVGRAGRDVLPLKGEKSANPSFGGLAGFADAIDGRAGAPGAPPRSVGAGRRPRASPSRSARPAGRGRPRASRARRAARLRSARAAGSSGWRARAPRRAGGRPAAPRCGCPRGRPRRPGRAGGLELGGGLRERLDLGAGALEGGLHVGGLGLPGGRLGEPLAGAIEGVLIHERDDSVSAG